MSQHTASRTRLVVVLGAAILAVSSSAVLVRTLEQPQPLAIAWWRCVGAALLLLPVLRPMKGADAMKVLAAGACLAVHFWAWFASLGLTTVMHAATLVCTTPAWAGLMEWAWYRRKPSRSFWMGLAVAGGGVALMSGGDDGAVSLQGDLIATFGAMLAAIYMLLGREVRPRVGIGSYGGWVCAAAAVTLTPMVLVLDVPLTGFGRQDVMLLLACVLGPQLIGHNGFNWALRYLPASTVTSLILLEPVGSTVLAALFLGEVPGPSGAAGAVLVVAGVVVASRKR